MLQYYEDHKMVERIEWLKENLENLDSTTARNLLEEWDNDQGRATSRPDTIKLPPTSRNPLLEKRIAHHCEVLILHRFRIKLELRESIHIISMTAVEVVKN